jgi:hypothetical protein
MINTLRFHKIFGLFFLKKFIFIDDRENPNILLSYEKFKDLNTKNLLVLNYKIC